MNTDAAVQVAPGDPYGSAARRLLREMVAEIPPRYGDILDAAEAAARAGQLLAAHSVFAGERGAFLLAAIGEQVAGCVALAPLAGDTGEIKRMYVTPSLRRRGAGAALLAALEERARALGYRRLWLETGDQQPEALALYAQAGYTPIPPFGEFADDPATICLEKTLMGADTL
jgi:GNAT superfamily N-acetyltransferase